MLGVLRGSGSLGSAGRLCSLSSLGNPSGDDAAHRRGFAGVIGEVGQDLAQSVRVGQDLKPIRRRLELARIPRMPLGRQRDLLREQSPERHRARVQAQRLG